MKKLMIIYMMFLLIASVYAQETGYSNEIEEAVANCSNCNICPDGKELNDSKICLYFFYGETCPHCAEEKPFLEELKTKYPNLEIFKFEVYSNNENVKLWRDICKKYNVEAIGVPMTFIGNKVFIGFAKGPEFTKNSKSISFDLNVLYVIFCFVLIVLLVTIFKTKKIKIKVKT
ncbi:MAG: thioredoxin family protein [Candidatus Omnitrophica bacterium]|nr:thioredoxin family protein [Candidatus Omnitrophota bacterium]